MNLRYPLLILAVLAIMPATSSQAVMRGTPVPPTAVEQLTTVAIHTPEGLCTGTIVGPDLVLTAAHCLVRRGAYRVRYSGADRVVRMVQAVRTAIHPGFVERDGFSGNDIALLQVKTPFPMGMKAASLPGWGGGGSSLVLAGFGSTETTRNRSSQLRVAAMEAGEPAIPGRGFRGLSVPEGTPKRGMCVGDSGGPVFSQGRDPAVVVGVLKGGTIEPGTSCTTRPLYTPVSSFRDWIEGQASQWKSGLGPVGSLAR